MTTNEAIAERSATMMCKQIIQMLAKIPHEEVQGICRTYEKTHMVVQLYNEGLVTPTLGCKDRLRDFYRAVNASYDRIRNI